MSEWKGEEQLTILRLRTAPSASSLWASREPIRAELFSIERLEQHAETLAAAQRVTPRPQAGHSLVARLRDNGRVLLDAYRTLAQATNEQRPITPAAEWLIDNFHVIDEQIREIKDDLPAGFYRQLPKLADGPLEGYPRVFGLAWAFVAHTDSRYDSEMLCRFVRAYQRVQPLTIGELWAVAITLRIVLVENLRRLADGIVERRAAREEADILADRLLGTAEREAEPVASVLSGMNLDSGCEGTNFSSIPACRKHGPASRSCSASAQRAMRSASRTLAALAEASPEPTSTA